jgi:hypothetical protein
LRFTKESFKQTIKNNENLGIAKVKAEKKYKDIHEKVLNTKNQRVYQKN